MNVTYQTCWQSWNGAPGVRNLIIQSVVSHLVAWVGCTWFLIWWPRLPVCGLQLVSWVANSTWFLIWCPGLPVTGLSYGLGYANLTAAMLCRVVIVGVHVHLGSTIMDVSVFSTLHRHIKQVTQNETCSHIFAGAGAKPWAFHARQDHQPGGWPRHWLHTQRSSTQVIFHFTFVPLSRLSVSKYVIMHFYVSKTFFNNSPVDLAASLPGEPELQVATWIKTWIKILIKIVTNFWSKLRSK